MRNTTRYLIIIAIAAVVASIIIDRMDPLPRAATLAGIILGAYKSFV